MGTNKQEEAKIRGDKTGQQCDQIWRNFAKEATF